MFLIWRPLPPSSAALPEPTVGNISELEWLSTMPAAQEVEVSPEVGITRSSTAKGDEKYREAGGSEEWREEGKPRTWIVVPPSKWGRSDQG